MIVYTKAKSYKPAAKKGYSAGSGSSKGGVVSNPKTGTGTSFSTGGGNYTGYASAGVEVYQGSKTSGGGATPIVQENPTYKPGISSEGTITTAAGNKVEVKTTPISSTAQAERNKQLKTRSNLTPSQQIELQKVRQELFDKTFPQEQEQQKPNYKIGNINAANITLSPALSKKYADEKLKQSIPIPEQGITLRYIGSTPSPALSKKYADEKLKQSIPIPEQGITPRYIGSTPTTQNKDTAQSHYEITKEKEIYEPQKEETSLYPLSEKITKYGEAEANKKGKLYDIGNLIGKGKAISALFLAPTIQNTEYFLTKPKEITYTEYGLTEESKQQEATKINAAIFLSGIGAGMTTIKPNPELYKQQIIDNEYTKPLINKIKTEGVTETSLTYNRALIKSTTRSLTKAGFKKTDFNPPAIVVQPIESFSGISKETNIAGIRINRNALLIRKGTPEIVKRLSDIPKSDYIIIQGSKTISNQETLNNIYNPNQITEYQKRLTYQNQNIKYNTPSKNVRSEINIKTPIKGVMTPEELNLQLLTKKELINLKGTIGTKITTQNTKGIYKTGITITKTGNEGISFSKTEVNGEISGGTFGAETAARKNSFDYLKITKYKQSLKALEDLRFRINYADKPAILGFEGIQTYKFPEGSISKYYTILRAEPYATTVNKNFAFNKPIIIKPSTPTIQKPTNTYSNPTDTTETILINKPQKTESIYNPLTTNKEESKTKTEQETKTKVYTSNDYAKENPLNKNAAKVNTRTINIYEQTKSGTKIIPLSLYSTATKNKTKQKTTPATAQTTAQATTQITSTNQLYRTLQATAQTTAQATATQTAQTTKQLYKTLQTTATTQRTTETNKFPKLPPIKLKRETKREENEGFNVLIRKAGIWTKASIQPLTRNQAINYGTTTIEATPQASFKIIPSNTQATGSYKGFGTLKNFYVNKGIYIEKNKSRINTIGELSGITYKGISSQRNKKRRWF